MESRGPIKNSISLELHVPEDSEVNLGNLLSVAVLMP